MKPIILILLYLFIVPSSALADDENMKVKAYLNDLISKGYEIVQDSNLSKEQKVKKSSEVIKENLHLDWMARFSLGRNKRALSQDKINEFIDVYSKFVVNAYAELSSHYNGEKAVIKSISPIDAHMFTVTMEIVQMGSQSPIRVQYLIHKLDNIKGSPYKVADVITEGVSILNSQQSEFNSVITNQGIDALIANLQAKNKHNEAKRVRK